MKGIPTPCIKHFAEPHNLIVLDVYKKVFGNTAIKFDLPNDNTKFVCRSNKGYTISKVSYFARKCQYIIYESDKFFIK